MMGKKIGITEGAVSNIEKGKRKVTDQMFKSICREFNVNEEWLRTGKGEMFNYSENDTLIEKISNEYQLDGFQKRLVQKYLELTEQQKSAVKSFLDKVYEEESINLQSSEDVSDEFSVTEEKEKIPPEYENMSLEDMIAQNQILENLIEKKQVEKLSALQKQNENSKMA